MKYKVGDRVVVTGVNNERDARYGDYVTGMIGTFIKYYRDTDCFVNFGKGIVGSGEHYRVLLTEIRPITKLDRALS